MCQFLDGWIFIYLLFVKWRDQPCVADTTHTHPLLQTNAEGNPKNNSGKQHKQFPLIAYLHTTTTARQNTPSLHRHPVFPPSVISLYCAALSLSDTALLLSALFRHLLSAACHMTPMTRTNRNPEGDSLITQSPP